MKTQVFIVLSICLVFALCSDSTSSDSSDVFTNFSGASYTALSHEDKFNSLWSQVVADTTSLGWYSTFTDLGIFTESMTPTIATYSDVLPPGRKLLTHTVGSVAQVEFIAEENSYTGAFQGGAHGVIRYATATTSDPTSDPFTNFNPAFGLKLFRTGVPSANILAMFTADGQYSWNPFSCDWTHHLPAAVSLKVKALVAKFKSVTSYPNALGLKEFARFDQDGNEYTDSEVIFPFQVVFSPSSDVATMFPDTYTALLPDMMSQVPANTVLYDVMAIEQPYGDAIKIGTLVTRSAFTTSMFGDKHLFFKHEIAEDDLAIHPDWSDAMAIMPPPSYNKVF